MTAHRVIATNERYRLYEFRCDRCNRYLGTMSVRIGEEPPIDARLCDECRTGRNTDAEEVGDDWGR